MTLRSDIAATSLVYFLIQAFIGLATGLAVSIAPERLVVFFAVTSGVHGVVGLFLYIRRADFVLVPEGKPLSRINLANRLTILRLSCTPSIVFLVFWSREHNTIPVLIGLTVVAFLTDLLDGQISRRRGEVTKIGRYLDSSSDYTVLAAITIAYLRYGLVEPWFVAAVLIRLGGQFVLMATLVLVHGHVDPRSTFLGKMAVFAVMTVYAAALLRLIDSIFDTMLLVTTIMEVVTIAILAVSLAEKVVLFVRELGAGGHESRG